MWIAMGDKTKVVDRSIQATWHVGLWKQVYLPGSYLTVLGAPKGAMLSGALEVYLVLG